MRHPPLTASIWQEQQECPELRLVPGAVRNKHRFKGSGFGVLGAVLLFKDLISLSQRQIAQKLRLADASGLGNLLAIAES